jgi:chorismate mutase
VSDYRCSVCGELGHGCAEPLLEEISRLTREYLDAENRRAEVEARVAAARAMLVWPYLDREVIRRALTGGVS